MKKTLVGGFILLSAIISINVNAACGSINAISTDAGTIKKTSDNVYTISVPKGLKAVNVSASATGDWVKGYGPRTIPTANQAKLVVDGTSCGGAEITYYINFEQTNEVLAANTDTTAPKIAESKQSESQNQSTDPNATSKNEVFLKNIVITGYELKFEKDKDIYDLEVPNDVTRIEINAEKEDPNDVVDISINAKTLEVGENKVVITVSNAAGKKGQYLLNVTRKGELDSNATLSNLIVDGYTLSFDPDKTNYNLTINKETSLDITATAASKKAKVRIKGNNSLKDGSKITIIVTAENGGSKKYTINIKKKFDIMDYWIYLAVGGGILLLLILLISRRRKKKKKKKAEKEASTAQEMKSAEPTLSISEAPKMDANNVIGDGMQEIKPDNVGDTKNEEVFKL